MLGPARSPAFERAVSCAGSVGALFARSGFALRLGADELPIAPVGEDAFLDLLAGLSHGRSRTLARIMTPLRVAGSADTSLIFVGAPPPPQELAILIHPHDPAGAPPERRAQLETRASQAHLTLLRAGWDCLVLSPSTRLRERWHIPRAQRPASSA
jgi:hypothetical protein